MNNLIPRFIYEKFLQGEFAGRYPAVSFNPILESILAQDGIITGFAGHARTALFPLTHLQT